MKLIDNNIETLKDNLISTIQSGSKLSIAASCFSMYAFNELMEQLKGVDELRFILLHYKNQDYQLIKCGIVAIM